MDVWRGFSAGRHRPSNSEASNPFFRRAPAPNDLGRQMQALKTATETQSFGCFVPASSGRIRPGLNGFPSTRLEANPRSKNDALPPLPSNLLMLSGFGGGKKTAKRVKPLSVKIFRKPSFRHRSNLRIHKLFSKSPDHWLTRPPKVFNIALSVEGFFAGHVCSALA